MKFRHTCSCSTRLNSHATHRKLRIAKFTLFELVLIVIMTTILGVIVLPALDNDLAKSQQIRCLNNLKQQGVCHANYQADYDNYICRVDNGPVAGSASPFWLLLEGYITHKGNPYDHNAKYRSQVFHCPSNQRNDRAQVGAVLQSTVNNYGGNAYLGARIVATTDYFLKISDVKQSSKTVVTLDGIPDPKDDTKITHYIAVAPFWGGYNAQKQSRVHEGTFNNLLLDGHAENRNPDQLTTKNDFYAAAPR